MAHSDSGGLSSETNDDSTIFVCFIETSHNLKDHTEYVLRIQRGLIPEKTWTISRRYSEFSALNNELRSAGAELPFPPKKIIGKMDREFITERQQGLQDFLEAIYRHHMLACSRVFKSFLKKKVSSDKLKEAALQHISMFFRSESQWEVIEPTTDMGWRSRKKRFFVRDKTSPSKTKYLLSWSLKGPDCSLPLEDLNSLMNILPTIQHPCIYPVTFATCNDTSGITIQPFANFGTFRDLIYNSKPTHTFLRKYTSTKFCSVVPVEDIQRYGRQLLEVLKYLHGKGYYYGHLHTGNIILNDLDHCCLLDLENSLLGLSSYYRPYFSQFRKIKSLESVDVYCFGHVIYEMFFGVALDTATCDTFGIECPPLLRSVLESILMTEACRNSLPSVSDLLLHQFFQSVASPSTSQKIHVKIPSKLKQPLSCAFEQISSNLKREQNLIHHYQRLSKAQAYHMSETEKNKRRRSKLRPQYSVDIVKTRQDANVSDQGTSDAVVDCHSNTLSDNGEGNDQTSNHHGNTSSEDVDISRSEVASIPAL